MPPYSKIKWLFLFNIKERANAINSKKVSSIKIDNNKLDYGQKSTVNNVIKFNSGLNKNNNESKQQIVVHNLKFYN